MHTPFYCYAYAFGELLVLALVRRYDEEGAAFVPRYLELLAAGGSAPPPELLARVGLDIQDPKFWDGGLALLEEMVEEAERLAASLRSSRGASLEAAVQRLGERLRGARRRRRRTPRARSRCRPGTASRPESWQSSR